MLPNVQNSISTARDQSVQSFDRPALPTFSSAAHGVPWMARAGQFVSGWWSEKRDRELRAFWKKSDHLSGAIYSMTSKMTAIPFTIIAADSTDKEKVRQAAEMTHLMKSTAQFGEGWGVFFSKFVEDLLTQDNGAFAEIIGPGEPTGPLTGMPYGFAHLDAERCQRTSDPEFPVLYRDDDRRLYKMHYTRVLYTSQMPSPIKDMNGVGFCGVSRCISVSQTLMDILAFKQEKLGSRPHRAIIITSGGLDPKDVADAFSMAEQSMDAQGLSRYSKVVVAGSSAIEDAKIDVHELSSLPDGFEERTSIELGMATIALALGMDARELFPGMTSGASRADALVQHLKQRGRGPGQIIETVENMFNFKYLPEGFYMTFDYQDDAQDRQAAETRKIRTERMNTEMINKVITKRTAREQMAIAGDIDDAQFNMMEMLDGRLDDGTDILNIFYRDIPALSQYMDLGVKDPLDWGKNDAEKLFIKCHENIQLLRRDLEQSKKGSKLFLFKTDALKIMAALIKLKQVYAHLFQSAPEQEIDKIIAADYALALLNDDPELGQKSISKLTDPMGFGAMGEFGNVPGQAVGQRGVVDQDPGKRGPNPNNPRFGSPLKTQDPTAPNGEEQMSPRDLTKPRKSDQDPTAKEVSGAEQDYPF